MNVEVTADAPDATDQLRSLHAWLADVQELRGRAAVRESAPPRGALGPVVEAVAVALGPAGAATAFASTVIAWLRARRGEVRIKVTLEDGRSVELTATNVADLDTAAVERQIARIAALLEPPDAGD